MYHADLNFDEFDVYTQFDKSLFQELPYFEKVVAISPKAVQFRFDIGDIWVSKKHLKVDFDNNFFISCWLYAKIWEQ